MIQQDHLQIFDLTLNVWAPLFIGNGGSYTKKEYLYNTRSGKVSFLDEQKFFTFLAERGLIDRYTQFMLSEQSNLWAFLTKDCGVSDAELKTLTRYQIEVGDALDAEHSSVTHRGVLTSPAAASKVRCAPLGSCRLYWPTRVPGTALPPAAPPFRKRTTSTSCVCAR